MTRRRRQQPPPNEVRPLTGAGYKAAPSLLELDRFSRGSLIAWRNASADIDQLHRTLYFGMEPERDRRRAELVSALADRPSEPFEFEGWFRLVPYEFSMDPLSAAGSLLRYGGRYNAGRELDAIRGCHPALYIGDSLSTAYSEYYQLAPNTVIEGLTPEDLALHSSRGSQTKVRIHGRIERILDVRNANLLAPFCRILAKMKQPPEVKDLSRKLKLHNKRMLIRTTDQLQYALGENWRRWAVQFALPAPSQVFAQFAIDAGYEAILYPSSKNPLGTCIAFFPTEIVSSRTFIELSDPTPNGVRAKRLDLESALDCCGWSILASSDRRFVRGAPQ